MSYDLFNDLKAMMDAQRKALTSGAIPPGSVLMSGTGGGSGLVMTPNFTGMTGVGDGRSVKIGETFEVGDEVEMSEMGMRRFGNQSTGGIGVVEIVDLSRYDFPITVKWENGNFNSYNNPNDLKKKKKRVPVYDASKMDALIIEQKVKDEIVAVLDQHKNHDKLFKEWGLGDVIEYGRGMTFMFYGPPGTGKTFGAHCIAKAMGTELLVISAADIQSSEPGGANRAIQQAFREAKAKKQVLFLDECDSLISSRNDLGMILASEVNTLLTEIEKFEGVAILATNRIENMDEALERRISLIVEFPKPDYEMRKKIWEKLLPKKMPLGKEVSIDILAKHELTGGQIKNVVLHAARMALADNRDKVEMKHFSVSIERLNKSKNLMGSASRYRQGVFRDDYSSGPKADITKKKDLKKFLETGTEEDEKNR